MIKKLGPLHMFLLLFVLMYYGRLSVVTFLPQYAIDNGIPAFYYSLYFSLTCMGSAISTIATIFLLRRVSPRLLFVIIGAISAAYEILIYLYPSPQPFLVAGLLIGLAAGAFWTLTFLIVCKIIDAYQVPTTSAFSEYTVVLTVMAAITPLIAGVIVQIGGYEPWLLSALALLIVSMIFVVLIKDPVYLETYDKHPLQEDLSKVLHDRRTMATFFLVMLFSTLTIGTWASFSRVFFANVGIRNVWLGLLSVVVSIVTIVVFWFHSRHQFSTRRTIATLGILAFGTEMLLLTVVSDPTLIFVLEGVLGTAGSATVAFATQTIIKNTFRERTYMGQPLLAFGMYIMSGIWYIVCGYIIADFGSYDTYGSILGVVVSQFGLRVLLVVLAVLTTAWAVTMWRYDGRMVRDDRLGDKR